MLYHKATNEFLMLQSFFLCLFNYYLTNQYYTYETMEVSFYFVIPV